MNGKKQIRLIFILIVVSLCIYALHLLIFKDFHHLAIYTLEDIAFIPIEVIMVSLIIHRAIENSEKKKIMIKLNTLVGIFFSRVGKELLGYIVEADDDVNEVRVLLKSTLDWNAKDYIRAERRLKVIKFNLPESSSIKFSEINDLFDREKDFLVKLLENPILLEQENFTELIMAVFHLSEELENRENLLNLKVKDRKHLIVDLERVYKILSLQWLYYQRHLHSNYPYLFSFVMRTNPCDPDSKVEIE